VNQCKMKQHQGRVLVVDDIPENLQLLVRILSRKGYQVQSACGGEAALQAIQQHLPELIMLDICMPQMNGYEVCQILKASPDTCEIPIIFISALDDIGDKVKAFETGGVDYITKPFRSAEVLARVGTHLTLRRLQQQLQAQNAQLQKEVCDRLIAEAALQAANQELQRLANLDGLTGLANRRCFDQRLEQEWRRLMREQQPLSLILGDIDFFKNYNDTYGHQAGDDCLRQVAQALQGMTKRPGDLVARYGGEEFAIILPNTPIAGAVQLAEAICDLIRQLQLVHAGSSICPFVTLSLGVSTVIPTHGLLEDDLIAAADRALYQAKLEGRDRIAQELPTQTCAAPDIHRSEMDHQA